MNMKLIFHNYLNGCKTLLWIIIETLLDYLTVYSPA